MSGLIAIKGFDYQATVILDRLFQHFDLRGDTARVRPEGIDDLDLTWTDRNGMPRSRYVQVKKPREDANGIRKARSWSMHDVIEELLPNTISNLSGNSVEQIWILGDEVEADVQALVDAGAHALSHTTASYMKAIHVLARSHALNSTKLDSDTRKSLFRWKIPEDLLLKPPSAFGDVTDKFADFIESVASAGAAAAYRSKAQSVHDVLPDVLSRITIECLYGSEEAIAQRVQDELVQRFGLDPAVVERAVFRNLRGFINDIAKQASRCFDREEFELELRSIWPHMLLIKEPPPLPPGHLARPDITDLLTRDLAGKLIEIIGVSGSGKTTLASEALTRSRASEPKRIPLYIEVTKTARLRDALAGVGFYLRRFGFQNLFAIATESSGTTEETLGKLGVVFASSAQNLLLIFDLVEGTCSDEFARDLARFILKLPTSSCRFVIMGQESAARNLSTLERQANGVNQLAMHGFDFEDFVKLASLKHSDVDRRRLWSVYNKVTVGKSAGILPALAKALVAAPSFDAMTQIAAQPAEDMLQYAEREKFARVSAGARDAAERLVCFALAFSRAEAEHCFPCHNVGMAIREMTDLGLLRANGDQTFEMHETVRAGLEGSLSLEGRRSAHAALAAWYRDRGWLTAEVFHLEKAGDLFEAKARAREAFLAGCHWGTLAAWIVRHQVVSDEEILTVMESTTKIDGQYIFPDLLRDLKLSIDVDRIFMIMRAQSNRVTEDYQWGLAMFKAALTIAPHSLTDLVAFALQSYSDIRNLEHALSMILTSAKRSEASTNTSIVGFFLTAGIEIKLALLPLMLFESRRDNLAVAFAFIDSPDYSPDGRQRIAFDISLKVTCKADTIEILHALPSVEPHQVLAARSPLLGRLAPLFWPQRKPLRELCVEILRSDERDLKVLKNAIRVLIFVMDPNICDLCDEIAVSGSEQLRGFSALVPSLVPSLIDKNRYEARFLDTAVPVPARINALAILAESGADMSSLYRAIRTVEGHAPSMHLWNFFFLQLSQRAPFPEAIALLRRELSADDGGPSNIMAGALQKLGRLPTAEAAELLTNMLSHRDPFIRLTAAQTLGSRRAKASLPALAARFTRENTPEVAITMAVSMVASGANSTAYLQHPSLNDSTLLLWKCILANRLSDAGFARQLVDTATDTSLHWASRRAAIAAAGKLPFELAMNEILPVVMNERSSLSMDHHQGLACHLALSWLLLNEAPAILHRINRGKERFSEFWSEIIEGLMDGGTWPDGMPTGKDAADWLFDRLIHYGAPANRGAADQIIGELHVPLLQSAVLRSLRLMRRPDLIEAELSRAPTLWLAIKCLLQRGLSENRSANLKERLQDLVSQSPYKDEQILKNVVNEFDHKEVNGSVEALSSNDSVKTLPAPILLSFEDVVRMLEGDIDCTPTDPSSARILDDVTFEEYGHLVLLADPVNDRYSAMKKYVPLMSFTADGHSVAQMHSTSTTSSEPAGAMLRPMIAAANFYGVDIPWHEASMSGLFARAYISRLAAALNAQDSSTRFYAELFGHPDLLLPELCKAGMPANHKHVDARISPLIAAYAGSGTTEFFEALCTIASSVHSHDVDTALAALFNRFVQSFDLNSPISQHASDHQLWRGFKLLADHPRFNLIEGWEEHLQHIMRCSIAWYHKQEIARVLERHPGSYAQLEAALFKEEDWTHFMHDEIERLDGAAERLFHRTGS